MTALSLALDPAATRHPARTLRSIAKLLRSPFVSLRTVRQLLQYNRRGFHPNDRDTSDLVTAWRRKLFGDVTTSEFGNL